MVDINEIMGDNPLFSEDAEQEDTLQARIDRINNSAMSAVQKQEAIDRIEGEDQGAPKETVDEMFDRATADPRNADRMTTPIDNKPESIDSNIEAANEAISSSNPLDYLETIYEGNNYQKEMLKLDSQIADFEAGSAEKLKTAADKAQMMDMIKFSIESVAKIYAASKGIKSKLSDPLPSIEKKRLDDLKSGLDRERKVLQDRIGSAKRLMRETYGQKASEAAKAERDIDRAEARTYREEQKKTATELKAEKQLEKDALKKEAKQRLDTQDEAKYEAAVTRRYDSLKVKFESKSLNDKVEMLVGLGKSEDEAKRMLGKDQTLGIFDSDPIVAELNEAFRVVAERQTALPEARVGTNTGAKSTTGLSEGKRKQLQDFIIKFSDATDPKTIAAIKRAKDLLN